MTNNLSQAYVFDPTTKHILVPALPGASYYACSHQRHPCTPCTSLSCVFETAPYCSKELPRDLCPHLHGGPYISFLHEVELSTKKSAGNSTRSV